MYRVDHMYRQEQCNQHSLKKMVIYVFLLISVGVTFFSLQINGYTMGKLFFSQVLPNSQVLQEDSIFLKQYIYLISHIKIGEPLSLYFKAIPYLEQDKVFRSAYQEVSGYFEQVEDVNLSNEEIEQSVATKEEPLNSIHLEDFKDPYYVYKNYLFAAGEMEFDVDMIEEFDFEKLVKQPIRLDESKKGPQVLIFHTHAREEYAGELTVIDIGEALKEELETKYNISVLHITDEFYEETNHLNRPTGGEYERMEPVVQRVLDENPSISVVIDMHRDGVLDNIHLVKEINGKQTARIMFVTPLCRHRNVAGEVVKKMNLPNAYIADNIAFALQMQIQANMYYPGLTRKIYCNEWRMSTHMKPNSLLLEWGAQTNTDEEALNAVEPVAQILAKVLQKD